MLQLNPQPPILLHHNSLRSMNKIPLEDFSNVRTPTKKYENYVNSRVNNVNDHYLYSKVWKQTIKEVS